MIADRESRTVFSSLVCFYLFSLVLSDYIGNW